MGVKSFRGTALLNRAQAGGETWESDGNTWSLNAVAMSPDAYTAVGTLKSVCP